VLSGPVQTRSIAPVREDTLPSKCGSQVVSGQRLIGKDEKFAAFREENMIGNPLQLLQFFSTAQADRAGAVTSRGPGDGCRLTILVENPAATCADLKEFEVALLRRPTAPGPGISHEGLERLCRHILAITQGLPFAPGTIPKEVAPICCSPLVRFGRRPHQQLLASGANRGVSLPEAQANRSTNRNGGRRLDRRAQKR